MRRLDSNPNSQPQTEDLPFGGLLNESAPGKKDGTSLKAEHIQDVYYSIAQVLQMTGMTPNGELEDGNKSRQFLTALVNSGIFLFVPGITYKAGTVVKSVNSGLTSYYESLIDGNSQPLGNESAWKLTNFGGGSDASSINVPFCPTSGSMDESGNNNSLYLPDAPVIVTKSLPTFASAAETTNGKDGVKVTSSLYPESIYKIAGQNSVVSSGFRVAYNAQYTVTFTFDIPRKVTAFTFLGEAVNNVTWLSRFTVFEGSNNGQSWTPIFTPESTVATEYSNKSIDNNNSYLMYRFTIMVSSGYVNGSGRPQGLGAINLFYENVVDSGSNVIVLKAGTGETPDDEAPFVYTPAQGTTKSQTTPLSIICEQTRYKALIPVATGATTGDWTFSAVGGEYNTSNTAWKALTGASSYAQNTAWLSLANPVMPAGVKATSSQLITIKKGKKVVLKFGTGFWTTDSYPASSISVITIKGGVETEIYRQDNIPSDPNQNFTIQPFALNYDLEFETVYFRANGRHSTYVSLGNCQLYVEDETGTIYFDENQNIAINNGVLEKVGMIFVQPHEPLNMKNEDVWFRTLHPQDAAQKINDVLTWGYQGAPTANVLMQNGIVIAVENVPYNVNGYDCNLPTLQNSPNDLTDAISSLGKPSDVFLDMVLPASGNTVIAPLTGSMMLDKNTTGPNQFITLVNTSSSLLGSTCWPSSATSGVNLKASVDCTKGDIILVTHNAAGATNLFRCIKDKGAQQ